LKKTVFSSIFVFIILLLLQENCLSSASALNFSDSIALPAVDPAIVIRQQQVEITIDQLTGSNNGIIQLSLFADAPIAALLEKFSSIPGGSFVWQGKIPEQPGSTVLFVISGGRISGEITTPNTLYHVRTMDNGIQIAQEVKRTAPVVPQNLALLRTLSDDVVTLTNEERAKYGLPALANDAQLTQAAQGHAEDMALNNYFDHTGLDGLTPWDRITAAGYIWNACGENIAAGFSDAASVVNAWMNSEGHRANILDIIFCDIGVGYAYNSEADYDQYWVQNFGRRTGVSTCPAVTGKAPDVVTGTAMQVGADSVLLTGTVNPNGLNTTYYFQIGSTTAYGAISPMLNAGSGTVPLYVQFTPSGFVPSTTYHYRIVAYNSEGTTYGRDAMFTTNGKLQKLPIGILHLLLGK
jgi:uncharacterized protein YkwD